MLRMRHALFIVLAFLFFIISTDRSSTVYAGREPVKLIVDTDPGVDDTAALTWLLSQERYPVELLGITTVAGNTTVENATNNVLTLLDVIGRTDIPVVKGAAQPLAQPLSSTGALIHGPDGLWFSSIPHDQSQIPTDVPAFYRDQAVDNPGTKLVALGPLTNLAQAVTQYPGEMALFSEIIILGGAKTDKTPRSDFNMWQDTEATRIMLNSGLPLTFMSIEASQELTVSQKEILEMTESTAPAAQLLANPLLAYYEVNVGLGDESEAPLYDLAAVMYGVRAQWAKDSEFSLAKVVTDPGVMFGQMLIGSTLNEIIPIIADDAELSAIAEQAFTDPNFDLEAALFAIISRDPPNANVILSIRRNSMQRRFIEVFD